MPRGGNNKKVNAQSALHEMLMQLVPPGDEVRTTTRRDASGPGRTTLGRIVSAAAAREERADLERGRKARRGAAEGGKLRAKPDRDVGLYQEFEERRQKSRLKPTPLMRKIAKEKGMGFSTYYEAVKRGEKIVRDRGKPNK